MSRRIKAKDGYYISSPTKATATGYTAKANFKKRQIEGYASRFRERDQCGDATEPGCFSATLVERTQSDGFVKIPLLWQHDSRKPLGVPLEMREDKVGLWMVDKVLKGQLGDFALEAASERAADGLSIGYWPIREMLDHETETNRLLIVDLVEVSQVTFPCLRSAVIESVKGLSEALEGAKQALSLNELTHDEFDTLIKAAHILRPFVAKDDQPDADDEGVSNDDTEPALPDSILDELSKMKARLHRFNGERR